MKIARLLIYEGDDARVEQQLSNSLQPGTIKHCGRSVSITCVDVTDALFAFQETFTQRTQAAQIADRLKNGTPPPKSTQEYLYDYYATSPLIEQILDKP
jgi:hypothetical protein